MKEELEQTLIQSLEQVKVWIEKTGEFVIEQTPLIVQELLLYNFWLSLIFFIFGLLLFITSTIFMIKAIRYAFKYYSDPNNRDSCGDYSPEPFLLNFVPVVPTIIGLIMIFNNLDWLKIWLAPRIYVLEYIRNFI